MKSPVETLFIISDDELRSKLLKILTESGMHGKIILNGKGTAESVIEDIFGFGIIDKDVIISFVKIDESEKICKKVDKILNEKGYQGIVFTVPIDAMSSDLFEMINGGKNVRKI